LECCGEAAVGVHVRVEDGWVWFATHDVPIFMPVWLFMPVWRAEYRVVIVRHGASAQLWTRNKNGISDRFPDIVAAATRQLADGIVLDGELVILGTDGRLSF
jgi:hypothetical protein